MRRLLLLIVAALVLAPQAAWAHGDEGELEVVAQTPDDTGSAVTYEVALTYANDGDPIDGATITALAMSDTAVTSPTPMDPTGEPGHYEVTIAFPGTGDWIVRFATADPEASASVGFTVEEPAPVTTAPPSTSPTVPPTSADSEPLLAPDDGTDDEGPPTGLVVGLVVSGVLVVGATVALLVRRRRG